MPTLTTRNAAVFWFRWIFQRFWTIRLPVANLVTIVASVFRMVLYYRFIWHFAFVFIMTLLTAVITFNILRCLRALCLSMAFFTASKARLFAWDFLLFLAICFYMTDLTAVEALTTLRINIFPIITSALLLEYRCFIDRLDKAICIQVQR